MQLPSSGPLPADHYPETSEPTNQMRPLWVVFREQWLTILLVFLLISVPLITAIWLLTVPMYEATRQIIVKPRVPTLVFKGVNLGAETGKYQLFVNTQVAMIYSSTVLEEVLDRAQEAKIGWLMPERPEGASWFQRMMDRLRPTSPYERLYDMVSATVPRNTQLITVKVAAPKASEAKFLADAVVDAYMDKVVGTHQDQAQQRYAKLRDTYERFQNEIRSKMDLKQMIVSSLPREHQMTDLAQLKARKVRVADLLDERKRELVELELERAALVARFERQRQSAAARMPTTRPSVAARPASAQRDKVWYDLANQIEDWKNEREYLLKIEELGTKHPKVEKLNMAIGAAEQKLAEHEAFLAAQVRPRTEKNGTMLPALTADAVELAAQIETLDVKISALERSKKEYEALSEKLAVAIPQVADVDEQIKQARYLYDETKKAYERRDVEADLAPAQVIPGAPAVGRNQPARDRRALFSVASLIGALFAGFGLAYLRETMDTSVRIPAEVRLASDMPLLGALPLVHEVPALPASAEESRAPDAFAEEIRIIRTSLLSRLSNQESVSLLVTSCDSQSGKTTLVMHLAKSLGSMGKRVLVVDADLSRPSIANRCEVRAAPGLSELLGSDGWLTAMDVVQQTAVPRVDVVTVGASSRASDVLGRGNLRECIAAWKENYDLVIIDGPPLFGMADAHILAGIVDHTVLSLRASRTRRDALAEATERIRSMNGSLIGVVLNAVPKGRSKYSYYGGSYSYHRK